MKEKFCSIPLSQVFQEEKKRKPSSEKQNSFVLIKRLIEKERLRHKMETLEKMLRKVDKREEEKKI